MRTVNARAMLGTSQPDTQSELDDSEMRESRSTCAYNDTIRTENLSVRDFSESKTVIVDVSFEGMESDCVMEQESDPDTNSHAHNIEFDDDVPSRIHDCDQPPHQVSPGNTGKIGRASCRERVSV